MENPLFLKVALEELRGFGSYEKLNERIANFPKSDSALIGLFDQVIVRLEEEFDAEVARTVLVNLAIARRGLSEAELRELTATMPGADDLQPILRQLRSYLMNRGPLLAFFHRQLFEAVRLRYLNTFDLRTAAHEELGMFFDSQSDWLGLNDEATPNRRKVDEVVWQYLMARNMMETGHPWERLRFLLTNVSFLEAKVKAGFIFDLAEEFAIFTTYSDRFPYIHKSPPAVKVFSTRVRRSTVELLGLALREESRNLAQNPGSFFQVLWNSCWWYDAPGIESHYQLDFDDGSSATSSRRYGPHWEHSNGELCRLLDSWRKEKESDANLKWIRSLRPTTNYVGSGQWSVLQGHSGAVHAVCYSRNGRRLASASQDATVRTWDTQSGQELGCFLGHKLAVRHVAYSGDGDFLFSAGDDGRVCVWESASGAILSHGVVHQGAITDLVVDLSGKSILTCGGDGSVRFLKWDGQSLKGAKLPFQSTKTECLEISPDGSIIAIATSDCKIVVLRLASDSSEPKWSEVRSIVTNSRLNSISISRDGAFLCGGGEDRLIHIWHLADGTLVGSLAGHEATIVSVGFSHRRELVQTLGSEIAVVWNVVSSDETGSTRVWDVAGRNGPSASSTNWYLDQNTTTGITRWANHFPTAKHTGELYELFIQGTGRVVSQFAPNGNFVATGSADGTIRIWEEPKSTPDRIRDHDTSIMEIQYSFRGERIATRSRDGKVICWDTESGKPLMQIDRAQDPARCASVTPCGGVAAIGTRQGHVCLYDATNGTNLWDHKVSDEEITFLRFAMDSQKLLIRNASEQLIVWDITIPALLLEQAATGIDDQKINFLSDFNHLAITEDADQVRVFDWNGNIRQQKREEIRFESQLLNNNEEIRGVIRKGELVVEGIADATTLARLKVSLDHLELLPDRYSWIGLSDRDHRRHVYLYRYEDSLPQSFSFWKRNRLSPEMYRERQAYSLLAECKSLYINRIEEIASHNGNSPDLMSLNENLGNYYLGANQFQDALTHLARAGAILEKRAVRDPHLPIIWYRIADAQVGLGNAQTAFSAYVQAICLSEAANLPFTAKRMREQLARKVSGLTPDMLEQAERDCNVSLGVSTAHKTSEGANSMANNQAILSEIPSPAASKQIQNPPKPSNGQIHSVPETNKTTKVSRAKFNWRRACIRLIWIAVFGLSLYQMIERTWPIYLALPLVCFSGLIILSQIMFAIYGIQATICPRCQKQAYLYGTPARIHCPTCKSKKK